VESVWLQASSSGNGIGLRLLSDAQRSLTVVVFPKAWQPDSSVRRVLLTEPSGHDIIALAETEIVEVVASEQLIQLLRRAPTVLGDGSALPLLVPTWPRPVRGVYSEAVDARMMLRAVLSLIRNSGDGELQLAVENAVAVCSKVQYLRPVLMDLFIQLLGESLRDLRRGYLEREESLPFLRGRPQEEDLQFFEAASRGVVRCRFDEFMRATPLNVAIVSALEISIGHLASDMWWGPRLKGSLASAVGIRRALADVPSAPRLLARRLIRQSSSHVRGARLKRIAILADALLIDDSDLENLSGDSSVEIRARTSRLWEDLVAAGSSPFVSCLVRPGSVGSSGFKTAGPWRGVGSETSQPDILAWLNGQVIVMDAKYKVGAQAPASADAYQAFAYSHLIKGVDQEGSEHPPRFVAMVYPTASSRMELSGPHRRMPDEGCELWTMSLPFPGVEDCDDGWESYQGRLRSQTEQLLQQILNQGGMVRRSATPSPPERRASTKSMRSWTLSPGNSG